MSKHPTADIQVPETFRLLNTREAARTLGISERKLWSLRNIGEIPAVKIGTAVRYDVADLRAWAEQRKERPRPRHT